MLKRSVTAIALVLLVWLLVAGITGLFQLSWSRGNIYPPYSTLRTDPLGAKVLSQALAALPGAQVERNFRPLEHLRPASPVTLAYAGLRYESSWRDDELTAFARLVAKGTRAVFAFSPELIVDPVREKEDLEERKKMREILKRMETRRKEKKKTDAKTSPAPKPADGAKKSPDEKSDAKGKEKKAESDEADEDEPVAGIEKFSIVAGRWGFKFGLQHGPKGGSFNHIVSLAPRETLTATESELEEHMPWRSALYFDDVSPEWRIIYLCRGKPVVIERPWGEGSVVLVSDSFFLSNEALNGEARRPGFLAWLFQGNRTIVFDEEHLGITDEPGVATLLRKYQLYGLIGGLALVALLFVWQNAVPFVPGPVEEGDAEGAVAGRSSAEGLITLLRRSIGAGQLMEVCVAEWKKAVLRETPNRARVEAALAAQRALPAGERDPVAMYGVLTEAARVEKRLANGRREA